MSQRNYRTAWANLPLLNKGLVVVAIPLVALVLATTLFFITERQQLEAESWVRHTSLVKDRLQRITRLMVDAETGVRGYLLTGNSSFLEPYSTSRQQLPEEMQALRSLITDNPEQTKRLDTLQSFYRRQLVLLDQQRQIGTRRVQNTSAQQSLVQSKRLMDSARGELAAMRQAEDTLLAQRKELANRLRQRQDIAVALSTLLGMGGGTLAIWLLMTGVVRRVQQLEENAQLLAHDAPLLPLTGGADEVGRLGVALEQTSALLQQRRAELHENRIRLQAIFDNTQDTLLLANDDGRYVDANPAARQLFGYEALLHNSLTMPRILCRITA
jgi:CHASE3 domain sensor protein